MGYVPTLEGNLESMERDEEGNLYIKFLVLNPRDAYDIANFWFKNSDEIVPSLENTDGAAILAVLKIKNHGVDPIEDFNPSQGVVIRVTINVTAQGVVQLAVKDDLMGAALLRGISDQPENGSPTATCTFE